MKTSFSIGLSTGLAVIILGCGATGGEGGGASSSAVSVSSASLSSGAASSSASAYEYAPPAASWCDAAETMDDGTLLCAVQPSRLDGAARDRYGALLYDHALGFGYHAAVFPPPGTTVRGVYLHLVGTYGRPYNQDNGTFASKGFLQEASQSGFIVLAVAYHNRFLVNGSTECGGHPEVDNCAGVDRREKITGENLSSVVDVPLSDAIARRLELLVRYFEEAAGFAFPAEVVKDAAVNWPALHVGGHSQGAGQALYLAKDFGVAHACMLAGIYDVPDDVPSAGAVADWLAETDTPVDAGRIRAVTAADDPAFSDFTYTYGLLGLREGVEWVSFFADEYRDGEGNVITAHEAAVDDPSYALLRKAACFGNGAP